MKYRSICFVIGVASASMPVYADTSGLPFNTKSTVVANGPSVPGRPKPPPTSIPIPENTITGFDEDKSAATVKPLDAAPTTKPLPPIRPAKNKEPLPAPTQSGVIHSGARNKNAKAKPDRTDAKKTVSVLDMPIPGSLGRIRDGGLPGLGIPPGKQKAIKPLVIEIANGVTELITISSMMPNRIATPYKKPQVIDASGADIQTIGSNVFILPKDNKPFGIYITGESSDLPVASLTLIPKNTPSQNILLQIDRRLDTYHSAIADDDAPTPEEYTKKLVFMLRKAMVGRMPEGFVMASINVGRIQIGPIVGLPDKRWSSSKLDIYRYKLTNNGDETIELTEPSFYESGVKAVVFHPSKTKLAPGAITYAYIVSGNTSEAVFKKNSMTHVLGN